ncbi:MAG TPA: hypothetical protein DCQ33_13065, partial [Nitrospira sp.]|nr:hypothetical protein [Nitrospira sp.]
MLRSFWTHQYRNLRMDIPPRFGRLNLLIGPNNSGKSNFIKAMGFLRDMLLDEVEPSPLVTNFLQTPSQTAFLQTADRHGQSEVLNRAVRAKSPKGRSPQEVQFDWLLDSQIVRRNGENEKNVNASPPSELMYRLGYAVGDPDSFPKGFYLRHEVIMRCPSQDWWAKPQPIPKHFFIAECHAPPRSDSGRFEADPAGGWKLSGLARVEVPVDSRETVLRQTKTLLKDKAFYEKIFPEFDRTADELLAFAHGFRSYSSTDLNLDKLIAGTKIDLSVRALDNKGEEFVNVLRYLEQQYDFLDEYTERLRELLSDLKRLKLVDVSETFKQLELHIGGHKYKPREMSDGTLKALWL